MRSLKSPITVSALAIAVVTSLIILYCLLEGGFIRLNYPSRKEFPVWGLDVSHHQGSINWSEVTKNNFQFVYIKATEGGDFRDPRFKFNWNSARAVGLKVGAYHFFTFCRPVVDQIANIKAVVPIEADSLPIAIDLEFGGNCSKLPSREVLLTNIELFISELEKTYNKIPILYVTEEFFDMFMKSVHFTNKLWFRDVFSKPSFSDHIIWQFANRGRVSGIDGPVDLNAFKGTNEEFLKFSK